MNESDWITCHNPKTMLAFLTGQRKASARKLRFISCACFRRVYHALTDPRARKALEVAEQFADGVASDVEREEALAETASIRQFGAGALRWVVVAFARTGAVMSVDVAGQTASCPPGREYDPDLWEAEKHEQCNLLRDLFGPLPFREVHIHPTWLSWNERTIVRLAQGVYDDRILPGGTLDNIRLAILADALEEAGCSDKEILGHCRSPNDHVRGCWLIDLLLKKE
jgi:hypothetical protein